MTEHGIHTVIFILLKQDNVLKFVALTEFIVRFHTDCTRLKALL